MNSSPAVVFVPGTLCDAELFAHQRAGLPAPTSVADVTKASTISGMAADVLATAPDRFVLAGLSLGGIVAAEIVQRAPERVLGLALLDTNLDHVTNEQIETRSRWASEVRAGHFAGLVSEELISPLTNDAARHGKTIFDMAMRVGPSAFLNQNAALMNRHDRRPVLEAVDIPVLVACGAVDQVTPPALHDDLVQRCVQGTRVMVPDAGHLSTIDQPAALTRVLLGWIQTCITNNQLQEGQENEYNLA